MPSDVYLKANAKYFGFLDPKKAYNLNWDVVWSFTYALTGTEHGFCTFLTTDTTTLTGFPGQYLGYSGPALSAHVLGIAFDSTGYFALSNTSCNKGIPILSTFRNSLIIRDSLSSVIFNTPLSSLDPNFTLSYPTTKTFQTLRFRYVNAGKKLYIDYHDDTNIYENLLTLSISTLRTPNLAVYPGLTFCSPISSMTIAPSKMFIKNFHSQGCVSAPTYEVSSFTPLSSSITTYTTVSTLLSSI